MNTLDRLSKIKDRDAIRRGLRREVYFYPKGGVMYVKGPPSKVKPDAEIDVFRWTGAPAHVRITRIVGFAGGKAIARWVPIPPSEV